MKSFINARRLVLVGGLVATGALLITASAQHIHPLESSAPAKLVDLVRTATRKYTDVNAATAAGYGPFGGCVSGPDRGAMGVHYVNPGLVGDGLIDANKPEALIYEPSGDAMRLVGV